MGKQIISNYSCCNNYTVESCGKNVSSILDKLIRLAAKITERYASGIVYWINEYSNCIEKDQDYSSIIAFRENAVERRDYTDKDAVILYEQGYIQYWHLSYDSKTSSGKLIRLSINP